MLSHSLSEEPQVRDLSPMGDDMPSYRVIFSSRLNDVRLERSETTCCDSLLHAVGAAWENERSVKTRLVRSFCNRFLSQKCRWHDRTWNLTTSSR